MCRFFELAIFFLIISTCISRYLPISRAISPHIPPRIPRKESSRPGMAGVGPNYALVRCKETKAAAARGREWAALEGRCDVYLERAGGAAGAALQQPTRTTKY